MPHSGCIIRSTCSHSDIHLIVESSRGVSDILLAVPRDPDCSSISDAGPSGCFSTSSIKRENILLLPLRSSIFSISRVVTIFNLPMERAEYTREVQGG